MLKACSGRMEKGLPAFHSALTAASFWRGPRPYNGNITAMNLLASAISRQNLIVIVGSLKLDLIWGRRGSAGSNGLTRTSKHENASAAVYTALPALSMRRMLIEQRLCPNQNQSQRKNPLRKPIRIKNQRKNFLTFSSVPNVSVSASTCT